MLCVHEFNARYEMQKGNIFKTFYFAGLGT
jgi:hypothetical protein